MDILIPAALVLCVTNAVFATLWLAQRKTIAGLNQTIAYNQAHQHERLQAHGNTKLVAGYKLAQADIYVAVVKATRCNKDAITAVRETLPPALLEQANERLQWITV